MNSIESELNSNTIANQVRLERALHKGSFLLVEGNSDARLLKKFVCQHTCSVVVCLGRERLLGAVTVLEESHFQGALGFADKDYSDWLGHPDFKGDVVFTDENDVEIMILCSNALPNVLREYGDEHKIAARVEAAKKRPSDFLFESASVVGALRLLSQRHGWGLKFEGMRYQFVEPNVSKLSKRDTVRHLLARSPERRVSSDDEVLAALEEVLAAAESYRSICCGHDCVRVLGRALRREFGAFNGFNSEERAEDLGKVLRIAYEFEFFRTTKAFDGIKQWEKRTQFQVLSMPHPAD